MKGLAKFIASFFYLGYTPIAPGTFGALGAVLFLYILDRLQLYSVLTLFVLVVIFYTAGVWAVNMLRADWGEDPAGVVVDEAVGLWISVLFLPITHLNILMAFILFRIFDIVKPLGIRKMERFRSGHGVMLDDVLAGIYANAVLQLISLLFYQV